MIITVAKKMLAVGNLVFKLPKEVNHISLLAGKLLSFVS